MSSTNRGYERHVTDYYVTPQECIHQFFNASKEDIDFAQYKNWFDPCAGGDVENAMSYPSAIKDIFDIDVETMDIRDDSLATTKANYLETVVDKKDIIITNPPFYLAEEIIRKALEDVVSGGAVVMLLRLNFFGSKQRFSLFKQYPPTYAYVHHRRMSFTTDGKTDSIEYMHAIWIKDKNNKETILKVI